VPLTQADHILQGYDGEDELMEKKDPREPIDVEHPAEIEDPLPLGTGYLLKSIEGEIADPQQPPALRTGVEEAVKGILRLAPDAFVGHLGIDVRG
jgi:hypothetical protein